MTEKEINFLERRIDRIEDKLTIIESKVSGNAQVINDIHNTIRSINTEIKYLKEITNDPTGAKWEGMGRALGGALTGAGATFVGLSYLLYEIINILKNK